MRVDRTERKYTPEQEVVLCNLTIPRDIAAIMTDLPCREVTEYRFRIKYKDAICKGEQEAIVPRDLWDRVKEIQRSIDPQSDHSRRQETIAPLKSILRCGHCGGAMMPTYGKKNGRRYHYYLCCVLNIFCFLHSHCSHRILLPNYLQLLRTIL